MVQSRNCLPAFVAALAIVITTHATSVAQYYTPSYGNQTQSLTIQTGGFQYYAPPLVDGDAEFGGDVYVIIKARFYTIGNRIYRQIFMGAYEAKIVGGWLSGNLTSAEGWSVPEQVYQAPAGWSLKPFFITDSRLPVYWVSGHFPRRFNSLIGDLLIYGDHRGDDVGEYTQVFVEWDYSLNIELNKPNVIDFTR